MRKNWEPDLTVSIGTSVSKGACDSVAALCVNKDTLVDNIPYSCQCYVGNQSGHSHDGLQDRLQGLLY